MASLVFTGKPPKLRGSGLPPVTLRKMPGSRSPLISGSSRPTHCWRIASGAPPGGIAVIFTLVTFILLVSANCHQRTPWCVEQFYLPPYAEIDVRQHYSNKNRNPDRRPESLSASRLGFFEKQEQKDNERNQEHLRSAFDELFSGGGLFHEREYQKENNRRCHCVRKRFRKKC